MFGSEPFRPSDVPRYVTHHILAEVEVFGPDSCHVAPHVDEEWTATDIGRSYIDGENEEVVEEFTLTSEAASEPPDIDADDDVEEVFAREDEYIYRVKRPADTGCVCECIESTGSVVRDITIDDESVLVVFLVPDTETLQGVIGDLRQEGDCVRLRRLVDSSPDGDAEPARLLDPTVLTTRQQEVLEVAFEMGYFEHPRGANAGEVADRLDIATATFTEHLAAAQRNLLGDLLQD